MRNDLGNQRWLGYELHDGLLQWIVAARMQLESAVGSEADSADSADSAKSAQVRRALRYVERALEEGRSLIGFLETGARAQPGELHDILERFVESVRPLAAERSQTIEFRMERGGWPAVSPPVLWNAFRIAEQGVRNAMKHAGPCHITVQVDRLNADFLRLRVADSGVGITSEQLEREHGGHFGLNSMRHRADLIRGKLQVQPGEPSGTVVTLLFPTD